MDKTRAEPSSGTRKTASSRVRIGGEDTMPVEEVASDDSLKTGPEES